MTVTMEKERRMSQEVVEKSRATLTRCVTPMGDVTRMLVTVVTSDTIITREGIHINRATHISGQEDTVTERNTVRLAEIQEILQVNQRNWMTHKGP